MKHKSLFIALLAGLVCLPFMSRGEDVATLLQKAEQGDAEAQVNLGLVYLKGDGVPRSCQEAMKWFRLAAEQNDVQAQGNLGIAYATGRGVPKDLPQAYAWMTISAAQGSEKAARSQSLAIKEMTPEQIIEGNRLAQEYTEKYVK